MNPDLCLLPLTSSFRWDKRELFWVSRGVGDRTVRMLVSAIKSFQPVRLSLLQNLGEGRGPWRQGGCDSGCHCLSICNCLSVCLDALQWLPVCPCRHYLMAGSFCKCFCNFGFICMSSFHCPSVWLTTNFCFGPIPAFQVNRLLSVGLCLYILCMLVCLSV